MNDRLNKIDNLVSQLNNNETYNENSKIVKDIKKKYKELKSYTYKLESQVFINDIIRYVNLDLSKLSITGLVVKIHRNKNNTGVKSYLLYNRFKDIYWSLNPKKVYIYVSNYIDDVNIEFFNSLKKELENKNNI